MSEETPKVALITGITGQDGSYLTELLLEKGYIVSSCPKVQGHRENPESNKSSNSSSHWLGFRWGHYILLVGPFEKQLSYLCHMM